VNVDLLGEVVLRQNAIRAENGAILFCHSGDKEPALDQEFLSGPRRFLLGGSVGAPAAWICVRMGKKLSGLSGSIVTVMQPTEAIVRKDATGDYRARSVVRCSLPESEMCAVLMVVTNIFRKQPFQMAFVHRNDVVQ